MRWSIRTRLLAIVLPLAAATLALSAARITDHVANRQDIAGFRDSAFRSIYAERYARHLHVLLKASPRHQPPIPKDEGAVDQPGRDVAPATGTGRISRRIRSWRSCRRKIVIGVMFGERFGVPVKSKILQRKWKSSKPFWMLMMVGSNTARLA